VLSDSWSCDTFNLEDHAHYTHRQKLLGAMDPNIKLLAEDLMKQVRLEIKETIDSMISGRLSELTTMEKQRDERVTVLKSALTKFGKSFSTWKPEVESSLSSV
jgi:hypothetical protein